MKRYAYFLAWVLGIWCLAACRKYNSADQAAATDFTFKIADTAGVGNDGASLLRVLLLKNTETKNGLIATFTANRGTLIGTTVLLDSVPQAQVYLKVAQDTGKYVLNVSIADGSTVKVQQSLQFRLRTAYPTQIALETDASKLSIKAPLTISTLLSRSQGLVTLGTAATYSAYQLNAVNTQVPVGRFQGVLGNVSGTTGKMGDVKFYSDTPGIDTTKTVTIMVSAVGATSQKLTYGYH